ncbi:MAG: radical SAM protein [Candidatus Ozemobacteraceae bacterium]
MCYAIPGKVIAINGRRVTLEYFGEKREAVSELTCLAPGDFAYAQGGWVIDRVPPEEASTILDFWKEQFFELQQRDLRLSRLSLDRTGIDRHTAMVFDRALEELPLREDELLTLLELEGPRELEYLYKTANFLRYKHQGNSCCIHGIIEFSNHCSRGCHYCGISTLNRDLPRYRLSRAQILEAVGEAIDKWGFKALVMQAGEDPERSVEEVAEIIAEIRSRWAVLLFISCGEIGIPGLHRLFDAGARGLLMRFETSNPELYAKLRPGRRLEDRLEHLTAAREMGYLLITGGLVGLPGQTSRDLLKDILTARNLRPDMYSFGPLLPHPATPLAGAQRPTSEAVRKVLAVCRIADPRESRLVVTTAFETLDETAREQGLTSGANSVMLNVTPEAVRPSYELYPNRAHVGEAISRQIEVTLDLLGRLGRAPSDLGIRETDGDISGV